VHYKKYISKIKDTSMPNHKIKSSMVSEKRKPEKSRNFIFEILVP